MDFSLMGTGKHMIKDIYGITAQDINTYLSSVWLKSSILAHTENTQTVGVDVDQRMLSLAQITTVVQGHEVYSHFRLKMTQPKVEILCAREVIVYFNIRKAELLNEKNE